MARRAGAPQPQQLRRGRPAPAGAGCVRGHQTGRLKVGSHCASGKRRAGSELTGARLPEAAVVRGPVAAWLREATAGSWRTARAGGGEGGGGTGLWARRRGPRSA